MSTAPTVENVTSTADKAKWALAVALVVAALAVVTPTGVLRVNQPGATGGDLQNGAPDGVALINDTLGTLVDSLSYEGAITAAVITGVGTVSLVDGTALPAATADTGAGSLCRLPNGGDTHNDSVDWVKCGTSTPGAANTP